MTLLAVVGPSERALRVRSGHFITELEPGLPEVPWPIERIERFRATQARRINLASPPPASDKAILWTNDHTPDEQLFYLFVQPPAGDSSTPPMTTPPTNSASLLQGPRAHLVEVPVIYVVENLKKFEASPPPTRATTSSGPSASAAAHLPGHHPRDELLGRRRTEASAEIRRRIEHRLTSIDAGVKVLFAGIGDPPPPTPRSSSKKSSRATSTAAAASSTRWATGSNLATAAGSTGAADRILARSKPTSPLNSRARPATLIERSGHRRPDEPRRRPGAAMIREAKAERQVKHMGERGRA